MKWLLVAVLVVHALIHTLGFIKEFNLAVVGQFSSKTLWPISQALHKSFGIAWLLVCVVFFGAAGMVLSKLEYWWIVVLAGILLSQFLIVWYWPDAKAGTVVNVLLLFVAIFGYGKWQMQKAGQEAISKYVFAVQEVSAKPVSEADIAHLPVPVKQWLRESGVVGKKPVRTVKLHQKGLLRTAPDGKWMEADAVQYFSVMEPAFVWQVQAKVNAAMWFWGKDQFGQGKGNMLIKAYATLPMVNASGDRIDQGSMLRFLGEICWFPSAALCPYIQWEQVDDSHAKATMSLRQQQASMIFEFKDGRMISGTAMRYMGSDNKASLQQWFIPCHEWKTLDGYTIPTKGDVIWKLSTGDFNYYQWEITAIDYDVKE